MTLCQVFIEDWCSLCFSAQWLFSPCGTSVLTKGVHKHHQLAEYSRGIVGTHTILLCSFTAEYQQQRPVVNATIPYSGLSEFNNDQRTRQ